MKQNISKKDWNYIQKHGLSIEEINRQLKIINEGLPPVQIIKPAVLNDGIIHLEKKQEEDLLLFFEENKKQFLLQKFVPASGAATRMFKDWIFFHNHYQPGKDYYERFVKKHHLKMFEELDDFLDEFPSFPFYEEVLEIIKNNQPDFFQLDENEQVWEYIHYVLSDDGLGYQFLPKALLIFHRYSQNEKRTALEEHLSEFLNYSVSNKGKLHFTLLPQHVTHFQNLLKKLKEKYPVEVDLSFQKPETDTIMLYLNTGEIVRDKNENIVFRPGGHGSLIENIQDLEADIIYINNIDNVQKGERQELTIRYKKILAAYLIQTKNKIDNYLIQLENEKPIGSDLKEIEDFACNNLNIRFIDGYNTLNNSGKRKYLFYKLNRPVRIAGVVKNTGEPGGGPFWVKNKNGLASLQIVEKTQIDIKTQKEIFEQATHFNPVNLVVNIKDYQNKNFNLKEFINEEAGLVTEKNFEGKPIKVYERPGLWNGAMDNWNTIFIEVPLETFTPVKTVYDLLKPEHQ